MKNGSYITVGTGEHGIPLTYRNLLGQKKCSHCNMYKDELQFVKDKSKSDNLESRCIQCDKKRKKEFQKTEKGKAMIYRANHSEGMKVRSKRHYEKHRNKIIQKQMIRNKTEKGKECGRKHNAKRKRNLGYIQMFENPFDESEIIDYHHVTDAYVVAIPRDLHHLYYGKNHRENTMSIITQIYLN